MECNRGKIFSPIEAIGARKMTQSGKKVTNRGFGYRKEAENEKR